MLEGLVFIAFDNFRERVNPLILAVNSCWD